MPAGPPVHCYLTDLSRSDCDNAVQVANAALPSRTPTFTRVEVARGCPVRQKGCSLMTLRQRLISVQFIARDGTVLDIYVIPDGWNVVMPEAVPSV